MQIKIEVAARSERARLGYRDFCQVRLASKVVYNVPTRRPLWKRKIPYWLISRFYDDLWPRRPNAWRSARRLLLGPVFKRSQSVCDLGCDTGTNSIEFARLGSEGIRDVTVNGFLQREVGRDRQECMH